MAATWFDSMIGRLFSRGTEVDTLGGLNFTRGFTVTPNTTTKLTDVAFDLSDVSTVPAAVYTFTSLVLHANATWAKSGSANIVGKTVVRFTDATTSTVKLLNTGAVAGDRVEFHTTPALGEIVSFTDASDVALTSVDASPSEGFVRIFVFDGTSWVHWNNYPVP